MLQILVCQGTHPTHPELAQLDMVHLHGLETQSNWTLVARGLGPLPNG